MPDERDRATRQTAEARIASLEAALRTARAALDKGPDLARAVQEARGAAHTNSRDAADRTAWTILGEMEAALLAIDALGLGEVKGSHPV